MYTIKDNHNTPLDKEMMDNLFYELNKELRKKLKKMPRGYKAELYVVGGACVVSTLGTRNSTVDVDAVWNIGSEMRDCINKVADNNNLSHSWCNCDFKKTKSYTNAIMVNSWVYKSFDRLDVRMVNIDLLLAMKLIAFREYKITDRYDCINIINEMRNRGLNPDTEFVCNIVKKYFSLDLLSESAKKFIGLR